MRWPLTGRDAELRLVGEALSGGSAGGVVIAGPAGVGKTRVAAEAAQLARAQGCAVEWVRASRSARSIPLGAFAALLPAADRRLPEGVELLAHARHALAERAAGRRLVLCVDDGQLLDDVGLLEPGELAALEALERGELVERRTDERRRFVDVAHPLHGEAVRAQLTPTRVEALHTRLAAALEARGGRRVGDLLRIAVWRLEAGATGDGEQFARAAAQALAALDAVLAERLARAAVQAGAGFGARLALARALAGAGRAPDAQRLLADMAAQAGDDRERAAVANDRRAGRRRGLARVNR